MIVSNGCHAYRIKPERDKFRATPKSRVGRPTVWSAESALLLKARFWEQNANRGHHGREIPASDFVAFVDAVEQRRAMEEYGNADWMIHAVN
jgi:hypothetical protein